MAPYPLLTDPLQGTLRDVSRAEAEAHFARLMAARPARRAALSAWLEDQVDLDAQTAPATVGARLLRELAALGDATTPLGRSLAADVALWLGDRACARAPQLTWQLYTAHAKATGYQRAVLVGFAGVEDPRYYVDVAHLVAAWADLAARGRAARADFLQTIETTILADAGPPSARPAS